MSQYMALAEPFDSCVPQFPQVLNGDNDTSPMVKRFISVPEKGHREELLQVPRRGPPMYELFYKRLERREGKKRRFQLRCLSTVVPLCLRAETRAASHT